MMDSGNLYTHDDKSPVGNLTTQEVVIKFEVERPLLVSINDQYMHPVRKTKRGSYVSYFAPSPSLKEMQAFYKKILSEKISDESIERLKELVIQEGKVVGLHIELGLPRKDLNEHDVSNFIKALEDCIVTRTGIDDSRHHRVVAEKKLYESEDSSWIVKITMSCFEVSTYDKL